MIHIDSHDLHVCKPMQINTNRADCYIFNLIYLIILHMLLFIRSCT